MSDNERGRRIAAELRKVADFAENCEQCIGVAVVCIRLKKDDPEPESMILHHAASRYHAYGVAGFLNQIQMELIGSVLSDQAQEKMQEQIAMMETQERGGSVN